MPKGKKECPQCKRSNAVRSLKCSCGFEFRKPKHEKVVTIKKLSKKISSWQELKKGDRIKVISGSGPIWEKEDGTTECIGHYGKFTVISLEKYGIHAKEHRYGHAFIYMGPERKTSFGSILRSHRVVRV